MNKYFCANKKNTLYDMLSYAGEYKKSLIPSNN